MVAILQETIHIAQHGRAYIYIYVSAGRNFDISSIVYDKESDQ